MQHRDFRNLCLLAVHCSWSASKLEIIAAGWAREKQSGQDPGFCMVSGAKSPWNPTEPHSLSRQQLQTQLLNCEANTSLKQIHTAHSPRGSAKQTIQKHARSLHRQHKHSSGFATRHNIILKPGPCLPAFQGVKSRKLGCQSKLKWQVKLNCSSASVFPQFMSGVDRSKGVQQKETPALRPATWMGHTSPRAPRSRKSVSFVGLSKPSASFYRVLSLIDWFNYLLT